MSGTIEIALPVFAQVPEFARHLTEAIFKPPASVEGKLVDSGGYYFRVPPVAAAIRQAVNDIYGVNAVVSWSERYKELHIQDSNFSMGLIRGFGAI